MSGKQPCFKGFTQQAEGTMQDAVNKVGQATQQVVDQATQAGQKAVDQVYKAAQDGVTDLEKKIGLKK
ncbi:Hypothetical predicted protein [Podarcis lilfordi]|uniref:Adipogenesis regulatory factor n=1 Tax=Podarcis lilfordi TaxID=74358 RepID=A0AA35P7F3_9SAUR|nr:Hypothetical predicted protein [Podarcis lilfordi]